MNENETPNLEEIRAKRIAYQELINSAGWEEFQKDLLQMQSQMLNGILEPLATSDLAYAQEFLKGEVKTMTRCLYYPQARFEELVREEQRLLENEEMMDE